MYKIYRVMNISGAILQSSAILLLAQVSGYDSTIAGMKFERWGNGAWADSDRGSRVNEALGNSDIHRNL